MRIPSPRQAVLLLAAGLPALAWADGEPSRVPLTPAYVQECGACHVAFAPGLLPASSWQHLMGGLSRHYGSDASLDGASNQAIGAWLKAHAATRKRNEAPPDDRITKAGWFTREHREVAGVIGTARVKSATDCAACHTRAAEGSYREREIRVPR